MNALGPIIFSLALIACAHAVRWSFAKCWAQSVATRWQSRSFLLANLATFEKIDPLKLICSNATLSFFKLLGNYIKWC
jgi:hypothetical protein